jgi:hypothetical protein
MAPRFFYAALGIAFGLAVIFAAVTTVKHVPATHAGASVRIG